MTIHANRAKIIDVHERRDWAGKVEYRELGDGQIVLEGYAATYEPYDCYGGIERGGWVEQIQMNAFDVTLATSPDVQLLVNHEGCPLARTKSGTLQLFRDRTGLRVRAMLDPSDPDVQKLVPKMRRGDMDEMSFGFRVKDQVWDSSYTHRTITEVSLQKGDVSVVNYGMNPTTQAMLSHDAVGALAQLSRNELVELRKRDAEKLDLLLVNLRAAAEPGDGDKEPDEDDDTQEHSLDDGVCTTCRADDPKKPYGDVKYADPGYKDGKKRYPIDTAAHVKAAWSYINMPKNQSGYTAEQVSSIKGRIKSAAKKFGIEISDDKKSLSGTAAANEFIRGLTPVSIPTPGVPAVNGDPRIELVRSDTGVQSLVAILADGSRVPLPSQRASAFKGPGYVYDPPKDLVSQSPQDSLPYTKTGGANEAPEGDEPNMTAPEGATLLSHAEPDDEPDNDQDDAERCDDMDDGKQKMNLGLLDALESTITHAYKLSIEHDESTRHLLSEALQKIGEMRGHKDAPESTVARTLRELREESDIPHFANVTEGIAYLQAFEQRAV